MRACIFLTIFILFFPAKEAIAQSFTYQSSYATPAGVSEFYVLTNRFGDTVCQYYRYSYTYVKMEIDGKGYELKKKKRTWYLTSLAGHDTVATTSKGKYITDYKTGQAFRIVKAGRIYRLFTGEAQVVADARYTFRNNQDGIEITIMNRKSFLFTDALFWVNMVFSGPAGTNLNRVDQPR